MVSDVDIKTLAEKVIDIEEGEMPHNEIIEVRPTYRTRP